MTKKRSPKQQQPFEDIPMADITDFMTITGIKMKYIYFLKKMNMDLIISLMCLILPLYKI